MASRKQNCKSTVLLFASLNLAGVDSPQSARLIRQVESLRAPASLKTEPLALRCLSTPDTPLYMGVRQDMKIQASVAQVAAILDDFAAYSKLFDDIEKVELVGKPEGGRFTARWEIEIPVFFIPNVRYEINYLSNEPTPSEKHYRYKLNASTSDLKFSDGLIVLKDDGAGNTHFSEIDYWLANWGLLEIRGPDSLWKSSISSVAKTDLAIKAKAEHPDWKPEQAREASEKMFSKALVDECVRARAPAADEP